MYHFFGSIACKAAFKPQWQVLVSYFEQHFEDCVLNTQIAWESAQNQINNLNTSKNKLMKIFRGFRVFQNTL